MEALTIDEIDALNAQTNECEQLTQQLKTVLSLDRPLQGPNAAPTALPSGGARPKAKKATHMYKQISCETCDEITPHVIQHGSNVKKCLVCCKSVATTGTWCEDCHEPSPNHVDTCLIVLNRQSSDLWSLINSDKGSPFGCVPDRPVYQCRFCPCKVRHDSSMCQQIEASLPKYNTQHFGHEQRKIVEGFRQNMQQHIEAGTFQKKAVEILQLCAGRNALPQQLAQGLAADMTPRAKGYESLDDCVMRLTDWPPTAGPEEGVRSLKDRLKHRLLHPARSRPSTRPGRRSRPCPSSRRARSPSISRWQKPLS